MKNEKLIQLLKAKIDICRCIKDNYYKEREKAAFYAGKIEAYGSILDYLEDEESEGD